MANFNFNKVILGGRLTADPELKTTQSGVLVTSFRVAVNRRYQTEGNAPTADFIDVVAWRNTAEFITRYFSKGSTICIVGSLLTRTWTDHSGQKRYVTQVVADEAIFVDSKSDSTTSSNAACSPNPYIGGTQANFEDIADDEDLPF